MANGIWRAARSMMTAAMAGLISAELSRSPRISGRRKSRPRSGRRRAGMVWRGDGGGRRRPPAKWRTIELADHGFGQGVAVTPIQLTTAYAAIANGGLVMLPYVVSAAV